TRVWVPAVCGNERTGHDLFTKVHVHHDKLITAARALHCNHARTWAQLEPPLVKTHSLRARRARLRAQSERAGPPLDVGQQPSEQPNQRQVSADLVDVFDAGRIGQYAEQCRTDSADTKGK